MGEVPLGTVSNSPDGRHELRFERDLPHSPEDVWTAITLPRSIGHWLSEADVELRPGCHVRLRGQCHVDGEVLEVTPGAVFSWTWPHPEHHCSKVTIAIARLGDGVSRVTLSQSDIPTHQLLNVAAGWHTHLDALPKAILNEATPFDVKRAAVNYRRYAAVLVAQAP